MIGTPGSGKSTFADNMISDDPTISWVSRDIIRFLMVDENEAYFSKEKEAFKEFIRQIKKDLNERDVIADATHLHPRSRAKLFNALSIDKNKTKVIAVVMRTPLDECIRRNELRKGTRRYVPVDAVRRMFNSFVEPTYEEYGCIFDEIRYVE